MATIVTVHGTFAHIGPVAASGLLSAGGAVKHQWWEEGSDFDREIRRHVSPDSGTLEIQPFVWSGDNSETERRRAGRRLYREFRKLEEKGEPYVAIGHSHGGSVIAHALVFAAARNHELTGLKKWLTVGTPFVHLRKERFLFLRLPLLWKAVFVASMMLLSMLLFFLLAQLFDGQIEITDTRKLVRFAVGVALTAIPFILFYVFARLTDARKLYNYRPKVIERARTLYAARWVPLTHEDDEAVNGLGSLRARSPSIFHRTFAVPAFSVLAAFLLPVLYLALILSPTAMVAIAETLRDNVYHIENFAEKETKVIADEQELRSLRREIQRTREQIDDAGADVVRRLDAESRLKSLRQRLNVERERMTQTIEDLPQIKRVSRFQRRFLEKNGKPCPGNTLCGEGRDVILNAKLLFHIVTDEVASVFVDDTFRQSIVGNLIRFMVPVLLVPVIFGIAAVVFVFFTQAIARFVSAGLAYVLDGLTWFEVKRSAMGNDTETEVALVCQPRPDWLPDARPFLPADVAARLTAHSNAVSASSIEKFRDAISEILVADEENQAANILNYLTWEELIHTSYFAVPEFQKLVAQILAQTEGFTATDAFRADPHHQPSALWLRTLTANTGPGDKQVAGPAGVAA